MKCDNCNKQATVHLTEIKNGKKIEKHLCEQCAAQSEGLPQAAVKGHTTLPFGPALAIGVMITCLGWRTIGPQFQFFFFDPTLILALAGVCCVLMIGGGFLIRFVRFLRE